MRSMFCTNVLIGAYRGRRRSMSTAYLGQRPSPNSRARRSVYSSFPVTIAMTLLCLAACLMYATSILDRSVFWFRSSA